MADLPKNWDEAKGRGKQAVGDATGDDELRNEGKADETGGKVKGAFNDMVDKVKGD